MEIQFYGANCVRISNKKASVIIDDNLDSLGLKSVTKDGDVVLRTFGELNEKKKVKLAINEPGEYEVSAVSIKGIAARAHMDEESAKSVTMYKLDFSDIRVAVVGHIFADLSEEQLEEIGTTDVLIVPVGNSGYTLDGIGAQKVIKKIDPKIVIPTHYADKGISYEVPQQELDDALKSITLELKERVPKLKLKSSDLPEIAELIVLERQ